MVYKPGGGGEGRGDRKIMMIDRTVYLVGISGYDWNEVRYVTLTLPRAKELFEVLRKELIERCKEIIDHIKEEGDCLWDIPNWEEDINQLTNMNYDDDDLGIDSPYIEAMTITE
jgi:hypothetical protein